MEFLHCGSPQDLAGYSAAKLRKHFLISGLFPSDQVRLVYSYEDRIITGGCEPREIPLSIGSGAAIGTPYLLSSREMGVANIGAEGFVLVDGTSYKLNNRDVLYIGKGAQTIEFASANPSDPARFYINCVAAQTSYPNRIITQAQAKRVALGTQEKSNVRNLAMYIHPEVCPSCYLMLGITDIAPGSAWNTMPPHLHERRMEAYLYFDIAPEDRVFHFMGRPDETKHLVVANNEVVISPSWSVHFGAGTGKYSFIWGMTGENQEYTDVTSVPVAHLL
ncbi:MAG: 5-dehydro-4-deoxy-D-glucuronate isomerase [Formivibrio sp.]|nr:5-dehydro-4-deoxy-D-glucuronate isomerase [Formivibrio sp.]